MTSTWIRATSHPPPAKKIFGNNNADSKSRKITSSVYLELICTRSLFFWWGDGGEGCKYCSKMHGGEFLRHRTSKSPFLSKVFGVGYNVTPFIVKIIIILFMYRSAALCTLQIHLDF